MTSHQHDHHSPGSDSLRTMAASATLHCLTGCAIGEILGLIIATALGLSTVWSIALAVALAFLFGYLLSTLPLLKAGLAVGAALTVVLAADTLSILTMEIVDNAVMALVPGAMEAGLVNLTFWVAMAAALLVAYAVAYPVNLALLRRGKGHALTHEYHGRETARGRAWIPDLAPATLAVGIAAFLLGGLLVSGASELSSGAGSQPGHAASGAVARA